MLSTHRQQSLKIRIRSIPFKAGDTIQTPEPLLYKVNKYPIRKNYPEQKTMKIHPHADDFFVQNETPYKKQGKQLVTICRFPLICYGQPVRFQKTQIKIFPN